jgi:hypothetical protein
MHAPLTVCDIYFTHDMNLLLRRDVVLTLRYNVCK